VKNATVARLVALTSTVFLAWAALVVGSAVTESGQQAGDISSRDYYAARRAVVIDEVRLEAARGQAAAEVSQVTERDLQVETQVQAAVNQLFDAVATGVPDELTGPLPSVDPTPVSTTTTSSGEEVELVEPSTITGFLFLDADSDGLFTVTTEEGRTDTGLPRIGVVARSPEGSVLRGETLADGSFEISVPPGLWDLGLDMKDPDLPAQFSFTTGNPVQSLECFEATECLAAPFGYGPLVRPIALQVDELGRAYSILDDTTIATLVAIGTDDVLRRGLGEPDALRGVRQAILTELVQAFANGIENDADLLAAQNRIIATPPVVFIEGEFDDDARAAAADVAAKFLRPNTKVDAAATAELVAAARESINESDFAVVYQPDQLIISEGQALDRLAVDAIGSTGAAVAQTTRSAAALAVIAVLVASLALYLSRFRAHFWESPRMVALLGLLILIEAITVRLTVVLEPNSSWYILPAVAVGYLAAVLFDNRMGALMAISMGVVAAVGTRDPGVMVFGTLATLAPIAYVSKVSSRRAFRNSVVTSSVTIAVIAAAVSWLFHAPPDGAPWIAIGTAAAWALVASLLASMLALAAMPFFESLFDVTTTLRLLELTDRNHEALVLLQDQAFGTFNHSLMVGTLADAAAKKIDANNLLARAAAYFHDIGKTENPLFFIENQFGISNPHDELDPEESANIVRQHVLDGMELARKYRIPSEVAEGIQAHHGDAIMRYFYEKARQRHGDDGVDPDDYRHAGHKPRSREMAIVMLADSVEGACRAVFGDQEPTPDAIEKVVNRVIDEKVADDQLGESDLTLGELTQVRRAFIEALVGHYHQRIPYPNFPGD